jgi:hypothetical protein
LQLLLQRFVVEILADQHKLVFGLAFPVFVV